MMHAHNRLLAFHLRPVASAWFSVGFRYFAWWVARVVGEVWRWLLSGWRGFLLLLTAVTLVAWSRAFLVRFPLPLSEVLTVGFALKVLGAAVLLTLLYQAYRARRRMVILPFGNFTGDEKLKAEVDGLAARLLDELASLTVLYHAADEAQPVQAKDGPPIHVTVSVDDTGPALREAVSADSKVKFGFLELPIGAIVGLVTRILQGPRLSGSLHREGNKLLLIAKIDGGGLEGSWRVGSDDVEEPGAAGGLDALPQMSEQMACRVFTDLVPVGSPRWRAVRCYFEGRRLYRETLRTVKDRTLNLRRAEKKFIEALSEDNRFPYGHYNLGLVYRDLGEGDSARAAFTQAVQEDPSLASAYNKLAVSHWNEAQYADAIRLCERVITLRPDDAYAWNLKGLSERKLKEKELGADLKAGEHPEAWKDSVRSRDVGAALAWRALCGAALSGRNIEGRKETARNCLRGAAVAHGMLQDGRPLAIFRQALFLAPSDPELHFEMGKVFVDGGNYRQGIEALTRAVRIEERPVFWAYLAGACAKQFRSTKQDQDKRAAMDACRRAMDESSDDDSETWREVWKAYRMVGEKLPALQAHCVARVRKDKKIRPGLLEGCAWADAQPAIELVETDPPKACEQLTEVIKKLESDHSGEIRQKGLHASLALAYSGLKKQPDKALTEAKRAVALSPEDPWVRSVLGEAYSALGDWDSAEAQWRICLDLGPGDPDTLQNIAKAYWNKGADMRCPEQRQRAFANVIDFLRQALEISEDFTSRAWMHYWLGRFHGELNHSDKAIYHLKIAQAAGFRPLEGRVALGEVYAEIGAYYEAEQSLREAANEALKLSRKTAASPGATDDAKAPGEDMTPDELLVEACHGLAYSYAERGVNLKRALRLTRYTARRIAHMQEKPARTKWRCRQHDCVGWIHVRAGDVPKGIAELEKALALGVDGVISYGSVYYHLACAYLARAEAAPGDAARWLAKVRECCAHSATTDLRGQYTLLIAGLLSQAEALSRPKPAQPGAPTAA